MEEEEPQSDILAYYVWIPRYKYRVWNITRQAGDESTYAYPAYSKGIDIDEILFSKQLCQRDFRRKTI